MNTSYTESQNKKTFDWNEFLNRKYVSIKETEWNDAFELASEWVTCAVGSQCKLIPRDKKGTPLDPNLIHLGLRFMRCIKDCPNGEYYLKEAKKILLFIEGRSAEILQALERHRLNQKAIDDMKTGA